MSIILNTTLSDGNMDVWECSVCGSYIPLAQGASQPACEYCRRGIATQPPNPTYGDGAGCPCPYCGANVLLIYNDPHADGEEFDAHCDLCAHDFKASFHVTSHYEGRP